LHLTSLTLGLFDVPSFLPYRAFQDRLMLSWRNHVHLPLSFIVESRR
jgi:hypothetical protein